MFIFKYEFSKHPNDLWVSDYENKQYQNTVSLSTDNSFYNTFFQLIQGSGYSMIDKQVYEGEIEETIFEKDIHYSRLNYFKGFK